MVATLSSCYMYAALASVRTVYGYDPIYVSGQKADRADGMNVLYTNISGTSVYIIEVHPGNADNDSWTMNTGFNTGTSYARILSFYFVAFGYKY